MTVCMYKFEYNNTKTRTFQNNKTTIAPMYVLYSSRYNSRQCNTIQHNTLKYNTVLFNTIKYNATQYKTIQYNAIQCNTMQYNAMQCNKTHNDNN